MFLAVQKKFYLSGHVPPIPSIPPSIAALPKPTRSGVLVDTHSSQARLTGSRKRSYNDMQDADRGGPSHVANEDKPAEQTRKGMRGRGGSLGARGGRPSNGSGYGDQIASNTSYGGEEDMTEQFQTYPPNGYPDPFAAIAALQAMGFPGMPQMPGSGPVKKRKGRCRDYDNKGFCARGDSCLYQHGPDHVVVLEQDEYDPRNPTATSPTRNGSSQRNGAFRARGNRGGRRNSRAEFSHAGPLHDKSATTIVVEQIPEDKFTEEKVQAFFSEFGSISEVTMQPYKRLALIKFDSYAAAYNAYNSPKVIFDNRFVKVYWYKPGKVPNAPPSSFHNRDNASSPSGEANEEQPFDREEFERKSQEAQRKLDEKKAQMKEMTAKRELLQKQKAELAQKQAEEKRKLLQRLVGHSEIPPSSKNAQMVDAKPNGTAHDDENVSASTKALRAKLAELEAEATSLGIDHSVSSIRHSVDGFRTFENHLPTP